MLRKISWGKKHWFCQSEKCNWIVNAPSQWEFHVKWNASQKQIFYWHVCFFVTTKNDIFYTKLTYNSLKVSKCFEKNPPINLMKINILDQLEHTFGTPLVSIYNIHCVNRRVQKGYGVVDYVMDDNITSWIKFHT